VRLAEQTIDLNQNFSKQVFGYFLAAKSDKEKRWRERWSWRKGIVFIKIRGEPFLRNMTIFYTLKIAVLDNKAKPRQGLNYDNVIPSLLL
jgi:hypothetical protein